MGRFDNRLSRSMYFGQFTRCLDYMSKESLYTKSHSQESEVMGMRVQRNQGCVQE